MKVGLTLSSTRSFFSLSSGLGIASATLIINSSNVEQHTCLKRVISEIKKSIYYFTLVKTIYFLKMTSSGMLCHVVWQKFTDVSEVLATSIIRAMAMSPYEEAASKTAWRNIPEDSHPHMQH
jgi:hypothetical protein